VPERKRKLRILTLHILLLPPALFGLYFFTLAPQPRPGNRGELGKVSAGEVKGQQSWPGVDDAVVEKVAREHGREAHPFLPLEGDLQLFAFLGAGAIGGFAAGYCWRGLTSGRKKEPEP
jgi:cobalt/nickel transport protein